MESHQPYTRFLADRLQEHEHGRVQIVEWTILEFFAREKEKGSAYLDAGLLRYRNKYPIEWRCIYQEITDGVYTGPEEYQRLLHERAATIRWQREVWIQAKRSAKLRHTGSRASISL